MKLLAHEKALTKQYDLAAAEQPIVDAQAAAGRDMKNESLKKPIKTGFFAREIDLKYYN
jgi:hypothetical protein